jgi:hypothetical protein
MEKNFWENTCSSTSEFLQSPGLDFFFMIAVRADAASTPSLLLIVRVSAAVFAALPVLFVMVQKKCKRIRSGNLIFTDSLHQEFLSFSSCLVKHESFSQSHTHRDTHIPLSSLPVLF